MGVASPLTRYRVHPDCLISTIYHIAANRLKELARGDGRHGSCGLGMGESRRYWLDHPDDAIVAADLTDTCRLRSKLNKLKRRLVLQMQQVAGQSSCPSNEEAFHDTWRLLHETTPEEEEDQLQQAAGDVTLSKDLPDCETAVFEGAQGVLLDEWCGFHPYTTWSTVTAQHAMEMLDETPTDSAHDITVLGVTRGYATRHGAGPFPTELGSYNVVRPTLGNPTNSWQGCLRSGPLDLVLLRYACRMCPIDALVVNCLDQLPEEPSVCRQYNSASGEIRELTPPHGLEEQSELTKLLETVTADSQPCSREELLHELSTLAKVVLRGHGPTFRDRSAAATAFGLSGHR